jgi:hypothetical protein
MKNPAENKSFRIHVSREGGFKGPRMECEEIRLKDGEKAPEGAEPSESHKCDLG